MIHVMRDRVKEPESLSSNRAQSIRRRLRELLQNATQEHLSQLRVTFEPKVWREAVPALRTLFSGKCAFCESKLGIGGGDVHHYRPKQNVRESDPDSASGEASLPASVQHLYYAWLAYEWDNLLLICSNCNKHLGGGGGFPIDGSRGRFLASVGECQAVERPFLIDPCFDEPSQHLRCLEDGSLAGLTPQGSFTIDLLGLNKRAELVEARRSAWLEVSHAAQVAIGSSGRERLSRFGFIEASLDVLQPYQLARRCAFVSMHDLLAQAGIPVAIAEQWLPLLVNQRADQVNSTVSVRPSSVRWGMFPGKLMLPPRPNLAIRRIRVRNFKAIEALEIDIPESSQDGDPLLGALALLGENATGKSSVLEAVALTLLGTEEIGKLPIDGRDYLLRKPSGELPFPPSAEVVLFLDDGGELKLSIGSDGRFIGNSERATVLLGYGPRRFFSARRNVRRFKGPWHRVKSMFDPLARLPDPTPWLLSCSKAEFNLVVRALRTLMLLPDEAIVRRGEASATDTRSIFFELEGRHETLDTLSEGYKAVIAMSVDMMRELLQYWPDLESARGVVLIDELDTHLHPRWKMRIAQRLRQALPGVQFLTSTHDPLCLRGFLDGEVAVLRRADDGSVEQEQDLPSVQGMSVQQLLTSEYFGLYSTEDPALDENFARYATLMSQQSLSDDERAELEQQYTNLTGALQLGTGPTERLVQDAMQEYLAQRRYKSNGRPSALRSEAIANVVRLWESLEPVPGKSPDAD